MNEAERELEAELSRIFDELTGATLPDAAVANIHSCDYAEDGRTFVLMADLEDGRTCCISVRPGQPITCRMVA